ncbi:MAG: hypothetical protein LC800_02695 [Acidobacteria bacterium]|nr:hypothetical protein [Acidobacteriota bacterium]
MANYLIAIGGTGARSLEAIIYLAAAGLFRDQKLNILIVDPDLNNGNSFRTRQLISDYHALHLAEQPRDPKYSGWFKGTPPPPTLFQSAINREPTGKGQQPIFWNLQSDDSRRFGDVIKYTEQAPKFRSFLDLFYEPGDRNMVLNVGYQGRTNVGAVALKQDLEETADVEQSGLNEFLGNLYLDLAKDNYARIFVIGSVFGGTGAAGIPTVPALFKNIDKSRGGLSDDQRARLRYGCAMMTPYFTFPKNSDPNAQLGPGADSSRHVVATQAALLHYAHVPPGYQQVYFIGAPARAQTNDKNIPGGDQQRNTPHYAELAAALAAWDFFNLSKIAGDAKQLHFADTFKDEADLGVTWETLPVHPQDYVNRHEEVKRALVVFTTFAYLYKHLLHNDLVGTREYKNSIWYKHNFKDVPLDNNAQTALLNHLNSFCTSYLDWLRQLGREEESSSPQLFNWGAFKASGVKTISEWVGKLMHGVASKYGTDGEDKLKKRLDSIELAQPPGTDSGAGLFIYLLYDAVRDFCKDNYRWK